MIPPIATWPPELLFLFHERAAIREFDGKVSQAEAERQAMAEVWNRAQAKQEGLKF